MKRIMCFIAILFVVLIMATMVVYHVTTVRKWDNNIGAINQAWDKASTHESQLSAFMAYRDFYRMQEIDPWVRPNTVFHGASFSYYMQSLESHAQMVEVMMHNYPNSAISLMNNWRTEKRDEFDKIALAAWLKTNHFLLWTPVFFMTLAGWFIMLLGLINTFIVTRNYYPQKNY